MKELICPNCGKPFQVDDADYAKLLGQVKNDEFQAELNTRIEELHAQWESEHQVAELREAQKHQDAIQAKVLEISAKDATIMQLQGKLQSLERAKQAELDLALSEQKSQFSQRLSDQELKLAELRNRQESLQTEALFDTLFVRTVSQQYYLRLYVDAYEELMPREIDKCFLSLNN